MHVDGLRGPVPRRVPDLPQDALTIDHGSGVSREHRQQVELPAGQLDLVPVDHRPMATEIDADAAGIDPLRLALRR